jgi:NhaA family Na+:H+ antiporter
MQQQAQRNAGLVMLGAALLAIAWANSPLAGWYTALGQLPVSIRIGPASFDKTLVFFVNDALMALFFMLVGLEIKRELAHGSLTPLRQAVLPAVAALGGMLAPALIFAFVNLGNEAALRGWAIPSATDIAFSLVVLRLAAPHAAPALVAFLVAIAVLDDLGAIVVIAAFYTEDLSATMLAAALAPLATLLVLNRLKVSSVAPYVLAGLVLWFCVLKSGVHATLAGVITAFAVPVSRAPESPADLLEHELKPWVDFAVLPLFALLNAGVAIAGIAPGALLAPIPLGIAMGLVVGKTVGVTLGTWIAARITGAALPAGVNWRDIIGVSATAGIGFTMSLFIAQLAYESAHPSLFEQAKLGIMVGSLVAAAIASLLLRRAA